MGLGAWVWRVATMHVLHECPSACTSTWTRNVPRSDSIHIFGGAL